MSCLPQRDHRLREVCNYSELEAKLNMAIKQLYVGTMGTYSYIPSPSVVKHDSTNRSVFKRGPLKGSGRERHINVIFRKRICALKRFYPYQFF